MTKLVTLATLLFASIACCCCSGAPYASNPYAGAPVEQIGAHKLPINIDAYLNGALPASSSASAASSSAASAAQPAAVVSPVSSYGHPAPSSYGYAPATAIAAPAPVSGYAAAPAYAHNAAPAYAPSAAPAYAPSSAPSYGAAPAYGSAPRLNIQSALAGQLLPGPISYKTYQSPALYNTVALPVAPGEPAVRLYAPQQKSYSANLGAY